jgi:hypothetical protein
LEAELRKAVRQVFFGFLQMGGGGDRVTFADEGAEMGEETVLCGWVRQ